MTCSWAFGSRPSTSTSTPSPSSSAAASAARPDAAASTWPDSRRAHPVVAGQDRRRRPAPTHHGGHCQPLEPAAGEQRQGDRDGDDREPRRGRRPRPAGAAGGRSVLGHAATTPSRRCTVRCAPAATSGLWVTMRMLWPAACSRRNSSSTPSAPSLSRAPVGSSASSRVGELASARAIASRCRCPPERLAGADRALSSSPSRSSSSWARASASPPGGAGHQGGEHDVLRDAHPLEQVEELEDHADVLAPHLRQPGLGQRGDLLAGQPDRALVRPVQAGGDVQQGRLAAARRAPSAPRTRRARPRGRRRAARAPGRSRPRRCGAPPRGRAPPARSCPRPPTLGRRRASRAVDRRTRQVPSPVRWWWPHPPCLGRSRIVRSSSR